MLVQTLQSSLLLLIWLFVMLQPGSRVRTMMDYSPDGPWMDLFHKQEIISLCESKPPEIRRLFLQMHNLSYHDQFTYQPFENVLTDQLMVLPHEVISS